MPVEEVRRRLRDLRALPAHREEVRPLSRARSFTRWSARMRWDETIKRWRLTTNRGDDIRARFVVMACGPLNRPEAARHPRDQELQGAHVPHGALGLRATPAEARRPGSRQAGRQARGARRHGRDGHPGRSLPGPLRQAALRRPAHAFERGQPLQPADRSRVGEDPEARLAEGAAGELPPRSDRSASARRAGPDLRLLDRAQPQHQSEARGHGLARADARAVHGAAGAGRLQGDGAAAPPRRQHRQGQGRRPRR